jgi:hypothetical protein
MVMYACYMQPRTRTYTQSCSHADTRSGAHTHAYTYIQIHTLIHIPAAPPQSTHARECSTPPPLSHTHPSTRTTELVTTSRANCLFYPNELSDASKNDAGVAVGDGVTNLLDIHLRPLLGEAQNQAS